MLIDPFGDVLPCVQWRRPIGNVRADPMSQLWSSARFDGVRSVLIDVKRTLEGEADHCPGIAERITGSITGLSAQAASRRRARGALPILP